MVKIAHNIDIKEKAPAFLQVLFGAPPVGLEPTTP